MDEDSFDNSFPSGTPLDKDQAFALNWLLRAFPEAQPSSTSISTGSRVGDYELGSVIGEGTFAVVYQAWDTRYQRMVALKIARPFVSRNSQARLRFVKESRVAERLRHPGIAQVYESGEENGLLYIAQQLCSGQTLRDWLNRRFSGTVLARGHQQTSDFLTVAKMVADVAAAVHAGHQCGVIHRDLKPENIFLEETPSGEPKIVVLDFGLACFIEEAVRQTTRSVILGTPLYMSPEQVDESLGAASASSDVFAIGIILYECLTGRTPFAAETLPVVLDRLRDCHYQRLCNVRSDIPRDLEAICNQCLRLNPWQRYATALQLADDLTAFSTSKPVHARLPSVWSRFRSSLTQIRRTKEIALALIAVNLLVLAWALINFPLAAFLVPRDGVESARQELYVPLVFAIVPVHSLLFWMSWEHYRRTTSRGFKLVQFALTLLIAALAIWLVCIPESAKGLSAFERVGAFGLMATFAEMQALLVVLLLLGEKRNVRPGSRG